MLRLRGRELARLKTASFGNGWHDISSIGMVKFNLRKIRNK
jgi:hypothetical protein